MANFLLLSGMFVRVIEAIGPLKVGQELQVLGINRFGRGITFVGVNYLLPQKLSGKYIEPIYPDEPPRV